MISNKLILTAILSLLLNTLVAAQKKTECERLKLAMEFVQAFRQGILSNEEIMKKYVIEGGYFKNDSTTWNMKKQSVKEVADEYMDHLRKGYQSIDEKDLSVIKYSMHEDEFSISDARALGDPEGTIYKLEFTLSTVKEKSIPVDINDLYVIKVKSKNDKGSGWFILFGNDDKILSFVGFTSGNHVGFFQF